MNNVLDVQATKKYIIKHINNSLMMLNDVNSFIFLRSKNGSSFLKQYNLGGGNFLSVIGQFAVLNFLAKIHYILKKGKKAYLKQDKIDEIFGQIKTKVGKDLEKYIIVPKVGNNINETEAFVLLVLNYPKDLGITKDSQKIRDVWKNFRDKITHIATLGNNHASIAFDYVNLEYPESRDRHKEKNWIIKPFTLYDPDQRKALINRAKDEKPELENQVPGIFNSLYKNTVYSDLLNSAVKDIADWMIGKINDDTYSENSLSETQKWLKLQFSTG